MRFPEFNYEWNNYSLEELTKVNQGLQIAIKDRYLEDGTNRYFYITNEFLKENSEKKYYIENPSKSVICTNEDILMTRTGNTGTVVTGVSGAFHNNFFKIKYDKKRLDKNFLYYLLTSNKLQHHILRLAGSSTIPDLNHRDFYSIKISIPNLVEQNKISAFISSIDVKLNLLKDKKNHYVKFKQYLLQNLFPQNGSNAPKLRFEQFTTTWNKYSLNQVANIETGFTPSTSNNLYWDGIYPWLSIADMNQGKYILNTTKTITKIATKNKSIINKGTLIMSFKLTIGKVGILKKDMYTNEAICHFNWKNNINISTEFMYYLLNSMNIKKYGSQAAKGITLNKDSLKSIPVQLPSLKEQEKIASFLSSVDKKIDLLDQEIEYVEEYKKGLLQKMFIWRVVLCLNVVSYSDFLKLLIVINYIKITN